MTDSTPDIATVTTDDGYTVSSVGQTAEQLTESLQTPEGLEDTPPRDPISKAASELGKRSAEARKAKKDAGVTDSEASAGTVGTSGEELPSVPQGGEQPEKPLGKPRDDPRARMLEATRKEAEAKRERDAAKAEAAAARRELEALKAPKQPEKAPEPSGKPQAADFPVYEDFIEALADWKAETKFKEREVKAAQEAQVKEYATYIDTELGKATAARNEYAKTDPEFLAKLSDDVKFIVNHPSFARELEEQTQPHHVVSDELILANKAGPRVMLHLSENPAELQRILALPTPQEIQIEMRLLARSLNGATPQPTPKGEVSKAKPPVRPVQGSSHISDEAPGDDVSFEEHARYWNAKEKRARA